MSALDTIFGFTLLLAGAWLLRLAYMLMRLTIAGAPEIKETSGSFLDVLLGSVNAWVGGKRVPSVSAGVIYKDDPNGGREFQQGFVSDEIIVKRVRDLR